ncbi:excalibur calcium-binding domain-containing protein [Arthrobacter echini]|uniref:excalibur calcium-binding domain-containing protein n=1 Tax=Arthrobacter echini TaxID=1529066 RepID=UPI00145616F2|nr:excalibur calcium-binding domain-containing protein [Arthrobacter echini]
MKKSTASLALAAVAGLTVLSTSPAVAAPFQDCTQAELLGVYNIPSTSSAYSTDLDRDGDGIGCENGDVAFNPNLVPTDPVPTATPAPTVDPTTPVVPMTPVAPVTPVAPQVGQMPVGGAETGIAQDTSDNTAALSLGAGLVLAAAAGGTFVVRRRTAKA